MVELREAGPADLDAVPSVHRDVTHPIATDRYTEEEREAWAAAQNDPDQYPVEEDTRYLAIAETADDRTVGFVGLDLEDGVVETLYVHPSVRGTGIGAKVDVEKLVSLGVDRGVQPVLLSIDSNHVAVDETVIQPNDERYWLYAAFDPDANRLLHVRFYPTRTTAITSMFLSELREKHRVDDGVFLVDGAPWLQAACHRHGLRFQHVTHGNRNAVERVFGEVKRRTNQFSNTFRHVESGTAENWLQAFAFA